MTDTTGTPSEPSPPILTMRGVTKSFGGVAALRAGRIEVRAGEVHALMGENGAGKSTLMNVLAGVVRRDGGEVRWLGQPFDPRTPVDSQRAGISMIHQERTVMPHLSVAENLLMAHLPASRGVVRQGEMRRRARDLLERVGLNFGPDRNVSTLSTAERQLLEIARALGADARLIIMDEPNSSLTPSESQLLFSAIERLKAQQIAVVYVSHRLPDVLRLADRVTVMRDGQYIGTLDQGEASGDTLVTMMVGRELARRERRTRTPGEVVLQVDDLSCPPLTHHVSFELRAGEVLGLAGLVGAGRSELAQVLFGLTPATSGRIVLNGQPVVVRSPEQAMHLGIGMVPEDRRDLGLFPELSVRQNLTLAALPRLSRSGVLMSNAERDMVGQFTEQLRIRTPHAEQAVSALSGGNQQKVVLARSLSLKPRVLILDEPTHGVDVGAKAEIYALMDDLVAGGVAILLISSDLEELMQLSDRVLVMREARIVGEVGAEEFSEDRIIGLAVSA